MEEDHGGSECETKTHCPPAQNWHLSFHLKKYTQMDQAAQKTEKEKETLFEKVKYEGLI